MDYLITFRTYGTWLHGDERGSVDDQHNSWQEPLLETDAKLENFRRRLMKGETVALDLALRSCVMQGMEDVARHRGWTIHALEVLSNHVHVVVSADAKPELVMRDFKAWATRHLREQNLVPPGVPLWAHHGSTRYLRDEHAVIAACEYVKNQQTPNVSEGLM